MKSLHSLIFFNWKIEYELIEFIFLGCRLWHNIFFIVKWSQER